MNYSEALDYLYSLGNEVLTAKLGLHSIEVLLQHLGEPHRKFKSVLIAGTNGKGSVAAFCDSILRASSYRTGLYTSPHLIQIEERIRINGKMIHSDEFARLTQEVKDAVTTLMQHASATGGLKLERHPTYFEMVTAVAFKYFAEQRVEIAILEVGLGGRLDATNTVDPLVAVITNVDLDHEQYLGSSIREIATEKAGIIKARSRKDGSRCRSPLPVVFAGAVGSASEIIEERCNAVGARLLRVQRDFTCETQADDLGRFKLRLDSRLGKGIEICLPLAGEHQVSNALTAIRVMELLAGFGYQIGCRSLEAGISGVEWPGRLEILDSRPRIILDGAHNPAAANKVREYLDTFLTPKKVVMVFGAMKDKAIHEMTELLFPLAREIVLTRPDYERAAKPHEILNLICNSASSVRSTSSVQEAIDIAEQLASEDDTIVFVGSLFLVGEAKKLLQQRFTKPSAESRWASLKEKAIG
jgi:dihydrofolate synthase/folylpolyglutamate synthase